MSAVRAEKVHQEKVQQEKLKAVKARLNFKEASQHSESGTLSRRMDLKERLRPRHARSVSGILEPRRGHFESPRKELSLKRKQKIASEKLHNKRASSSSQKRRLSEMKRDGESTEKFMRRYKLECRDVKGAPEYMKISGFMHRITNPGLIKRLHDKIPKSVDEMMRVTTAFLIGEVTASGLGHTTDECMHLKMQIEEMLKTGKLSHLIKELKQSNGKDQAKASKKGETSGKDKSLAILMVQPMAEGEEDGMEGPMIIEAKMRGHCVHRMYVDGGSSSEILNEHCFNRFRPEVRNQIIPATTPLVGFSGEIIWPLGQISLLVKIGDEEHSTSTWMNFMVVRSPSHYNEIIGRSGVRRIRADSSTAHGMLKFPVIGETVTFRSSRIIPLECTMVSGPGVPQPLINQVIEEKILVAIHPEYPKQSVAMGSTLTKEGQKDLCGLLRRNLDIFA
ncbi:reverse transcriptase domain-containing protein [Tanacetum coccineum]